MDFPWFSTFSDIMSSHLFLLRFRLMLYRWCMIMLDFLRVSTWLAALQQSSVDVVWIAVQSEDHRNLQDISEVDSGTLRTIHLSCWETQEMNHQVTAWRAGSTVNYSKLQVRYLRKFMEIWDCVRSLALWHIVTLCFLWGHCFWRAPRLLDGLEISTDSKRSQLCLHVGSSDPGEFEL